MGWQWHQLDHMQVICTSLQIDNHASTSSLNLFTGQMLLLSPNQQVSVSVRVRVGWREQFLWIWIHTQQCPPKNIVLLSCSSALQLCLVQMQLVQPLTEN